LCSAPVPSELELVMDIADARLVSVFVPPLGVVTGDTAELRLDPLLLDGPVQISYPLAVRNLRRTRSFMTRRTTSVSGQFRPEWALEIRMLHRWNRENEWF
jgi:hypothetical protein